VLDETGTALLVGPPFHIVGATGMTKDGLADVVWHNGLTGETQIWFLKGERVARRATVLDETGTALLVGPPFRIVGGGDVYLDASSAYVLWHNSQTDDIQLWFMNGAQIVSRGEVLDEHGHIIQVGDPWHIAGVTGLASEAAIVWHNSQTNDIQLWFMNGAQIVSRGEVLDEHGHIIQVGDPWHIAGPETA
jgi:hypothetical protein